jgi:mannose-6-phosphate isomerase-like protein (cupin superfamily)
MHIEPVIKPRDEDREYLTDERCYILELSNDPDDPAVSIARARVTPGQTTRWHRVIDTDERYVIVSGQGRVEVGDDNQASVGAGDIVRIPAGVPQRIANTGDEDLVFLCICTPRFEWDCYDALE